MEDPIAKNASGGVSLVIDATLRNEKESEEMTSSSPSTPSSPRQEPVGMNNVEEEHFSVRLFLCVLLLLFWIIDNAGLTVFGIIFD